MDRSGPLTVKARLRPGGIMVVPLKGALAGGMVARLTKLPDSAATGHILHTPAAFMPLKSGTERPRSPQPDHETCGDRWKPLAG